MFDAKSEKYENCEYTRTQTYYKTKIVVVGQTLKLHFLAFCQVFLQKLMFLFFQRLFHNVCTA